VPLKNIHDEDIIPLFEDILPSRKGFHIMLKVFLDRGEKVAKDKTDDVVCVAAIVFKPVHYKQFIRPWNRMLRGWGASAFHATDFYSGYGEFKRDTPEKEERFQSDSRFIPSLIGKHLYRLEMISFRPSEFARTASQRWKDRFGTELHGIAVQLCMVSLGWWLNDHHASEQFAYIRESGDRGEGDVDDAIRGVRNDPEYSRVVRIHSYRRVAKGAARGTEAADFAAWHWNKHYIDRARLGEDTPRKDFAAFGNAAEEKVSSAFITGDKLKEFLRVCDQP
jgi:hypothetical protein